LILQEEVADDFVCANGISNSVQGLVEYVFGHLNLEWRKHVKINPRYMRHEQLHNLKGDSTKLRAATNWEYEYIFETMLDEMIDYWLEQ
jgi:GDPmannose 4,6-dehydratase